MTPDFLRVVEQIKEKVIFNRQNLFELDTVRARQFTYNSVGREEVNNI